MGAYWPTVLKIRWGAIENDTQSQLLASILMIAHNAQTYLQVHMYTPNQQVPVPRTKINTQTLSLPFSLS